MAATMNETNLLRRLTELELRIDSIDRGQVRYLRGRGWTWRDIHEQRYPMLSYYKVRLLGSQNHEIIRKPKP